MFLPCLTSLLSVLCQIYCKVLESGGNQGKVPVSGLSGEFGSTCVVEGPNTWEATGGHGPGEVRVGWRAITEGLVAWGD